MTSDVCGAETSDGTPCGNPTTSDGDPDACWVPSHGGNATDHGRPPKLTRELADRAAELIAHGEGEHDQPWLVKNVWAHDDIDVWKGTWYDWLDKGREHLERGEDTVYAYFAYRIARADREAEHYWHAVATDGMIHRAEEVETDDGSEFVPKRLDPRTGEEVGETVETSNILDYMARRWPERWSTKQEVEHSGQVGVESDDLVEALQEGYLEREEDDEDG